MKTPRGLRFDLLAQNHVSIASSSLYLTKAACMKNIDAVIQCCANAKIEDQTLAACKPQKAPKFEIYREASGRFRFCLKSKEGRVLLISDAYRAKASCQNGIASVKRNAINADVFVEDYGS